MRGHRTGCECIECNERACRIVTNWAYASKRNRGWLEARLRKLDAIRKAKGEGDA